jgi:DNA (cytosine-5)-methyltransferase 1
MPTVGSLFSGIGGFDLGLERAGWQVAWQVELDLFCQRVLARHWPGVARYADVRRFRAGLVGRADADAASRGGEPPFPSEHIDLLVGGFPCQDLSVAGKRGGLAGKRSGLFWEIVRIAKALKPTWGLFENVPGLLSSAGGRDMGLVLAGLRECWPAVGYRVLDSRYFGVAQRRRRVFFVCGPDERRVQEVLFEPASGGVDLAASGEAGARVARCIASCTNAARYDGDTENFVVGTIREHVRPGSNTDHAVVVGALGSDKAKGGWRCGPDETAANQLVTHALSCEGADASEDGTAPLVALPFDTTQITSKGNYSQPKPGDLCHPLAEGAHPPAIAFAWQQGDDSKFNKDGRGRSWVARAGDYTGALSETRHDAVAHHMAVRRLTPTECERLQGFPDGWTGEDGDPDSPRYRALGNAVTVNVIEWLGRRLMQQFRESDERQLPRSS